MRKYTELNSSQSINYKGDLKAGQVAVKNIFKYVKKRSKLIKTDLILTFYPTNLP